MISCFLYNDHLYINIPLEGIILDYQRTIHEIRHCLNAPSKGRKISNDLDKENDKLMKLVRSELKKHK